MNEERLNARKVYRVQAVDRALDILDCFDFQNRDLSLTEIARKTGLNKTTTMRLTSNLVARNYLNRDSGKGRYSLGMKLFDLGAVVFSSFSLRKAASRHMTSLQQATSATVLMGVLMDDQLVYVDKREGDVPVRIASDIGWRRPPHFGMLGMVLLAWLQVEEVDELLVKYGLEAVTPATITNSKTFKLRLAEIAEKGYVVKHGEAVEGVIGVAAPIRDYSRTVVAAIGVALLEAQHDSSSVTKVVNLVRSAARAVSEELGYREG